MKISTKGRIATLTALGTIGAIAAMIWWANTEVNDAHRHRRQTVEIAKALNDLRLVTFEYILHRPERARVQEQEVSARLDRLLANNPYSDSEATQVFADLRERTAATHRIFLELVASPGVRSGAADGETIRRFEAQSSSRLLLLQQQSLADAFRL